MEFQLVVADFLVIGTISTYLAGDCGTEPHSREFVTFINTTDRSKLDIDLQEYNIKMEHFLLGWLSLEDEYEGRLDDLVARVREIVLTEQAKAGIQPHEGFVP